MNNFAILNLKYDYLTDGIAITTTTNIACHLTLYWTDIPPRRHPTARVFRGFETPWGAYFCFVGWRAVEQIEAGDTLTHTFLLHPWEICETRWFIFRGTVNDITSPSVGPIFTYHCDHYLTTATFIARTSDGDIRTPTHIPNYLTAHDGFAAHVVDTATSFAVGQQHASGWYLIYRAGLFFDTSSIPEAYDIISATLSFRTKTAYGSGYDFVVVNGDDLSEPLQPAHYHDLLDDIVSLGSRSLLGSNTVHHINLNTLGLAQINKSGLTKLAIRTNEDIDTSPPHLWRHSYINSAETTRKPYLTITY